MKKFDLTANTMMEMCMCMCCMCMDFCVQNSDKFSISEIACATA